MVAVNFFDNQNYLNNGDNFANGSYNLQNPSQDHGIFAEQMSKKDGAKSLEAQLDEVKDKNGNFLKKWDNIKNTVGLGTSSDDCDSAINKYKAGMISYEEASAEIEKYNQKQDSSLDLFSNIATGIAAVTVATLAGAAIVASGGTATPLVLAAIGAGTGAVTKAGLKTADRATNEVKGDALDAKQITKDALSGAVTGGVAAVTAGNGSAGETLVQSVTKSAAKSMKTGAKTGTVSGAANYLIDVAFEDDKEFDTKEFILSTATNAAVGSVVGGIMGSANGAMKYSGVLKHGGSLTPIVDNAGNAVQAHSTAQDILANSLCNAEYKLVTKGVRSFAA